MNKLNDEDIIKAFEGCNFGPRRDPVKLLKQGLLKVMCGYWNGRTMTCLLEHFNLVKTTYKRGELRIKVTDFGLEQCYDWFKLDTRIGEDAPSEST